MKSICIKSNNINCLNYLLNEFKNIDIDNVFFSCNEFKCYKNIIIHYKGSNESSFLLKISNILSNLVIDEFEENIIKKYIFHNYFYFNNSERQHIFNLCINSYSLNVDYYNSKYEILCTNFYNYLISNKCIILNGFINFRLKEYCKIIEKIVDDAVNNFIIEREYNEFISLLKLYISSQPSNMEVVHLIYSKKYSLLIDDYKQPINVDSDIFKTKYLSDISFSSNDYILNSLLTILPKKIYVHLVNKYFDEFINTLQLVFENRIKLCYDCNICNLYKKIDKTSLDQ